MYGLEDPLDSPDFDPIAFINQNFPTGNQSNDKMHHYGILMHCDVTSFAACSWQLLLPAYIPKLIQFEQYNLIFKFPFFNDILSESSLDGLDTFVVGISSQISTLDEEISKAVQAQSVAGKQASKVRTFLDQRTFPGHI